MIYIAFISQRHVTYVHPPIIKKNWDTMFAPKSSHKRKRSAARRDAAQKGLHTGHSIISLYKSEKGKAKRIIDDQMQSSSNPGPEKLAKVIDSHIFTHQTSIILPFSRNHKQVSKILPSSDRIISYSARVSLKLFLDPLFLLSYIKTGQLTVLSDGHLDSDDVICIDGRGHLILSLCKETYYDLGLEGRALKSSKSASGRAADRRSGEAERFVVLIDLLAPSFEPGKAGYDRIASRLHAWDRQRGDFDHQGSWNIMMNWCADENSIGEEIKFPRNNVTHGSVKRVPVENSHQIIRDAWLPAEGNLLNLAKGWSESPEEEEMQCVEWCNALGEQMEWGSMNILNCDCIRTFWRPDDFISDSKKQSYEPGEVLKVTYTGFLPSSFEKLILRDVQRLLNNVSTSSFCMIESVGFADAPISWSLRSTTTSKQLSETTLQERSGNGFSSDFDSDAVERTGPKARWKRNKIRKKRSYTNPNQFGIQSRNECSYAVASGWQTILLAIQNEHDQLRNCIIIENIGDAQRS